MSEHIEDTNRRFLCFSLGEEEFAVPLLTVKEVIAVPDTTPIPFMPSYFLGIMNLRGMVISIIDLRLKLGIKAKKSNEDAIIILDFGDLTIGASVDSVNSVLTIKPQDLTEAAGGKNKSKIDYITGIYRKEDRLVLLIDLKQTLNSDDMAIATQGQNKKAS